MKAVKILCLGTDFLKMNLGSLRQTLGMLCLMIGLWGIPSSQLFGETYEEYRYRRMLEEAEKSRLEDLESRYRAEQRADRLARNGQASNGELFLGFLVLGGIGLWWLYFACKNESKKLAHDRAQNVDLLLLRLRSQHGFNAERVIVDIGVSSGLALNSEASHLVLFKVDQFFVRMLLFPASELVGAVVKENKHIQTQNVSIRLITRQDGQVVTEDFILWEGPHTEAIANSPYSEALIKATDWCEAIEMVRVKGGTKGRPFILTHGDPDRARREKEIRENLVRWFTEQGQRIRRAMSIRPTGRTVLYSAGGLIAGFILLFILVSPAP